MIRIICTEIEYGAAAHVGGPGCITHKTFDVDIPELESWLMQPSKEKWSYCQRFCNGIEVTVEAVKP